MEIKDLLKFNYLFNKKLFFFRYFVNKNCLKHISVRINIFGTGIFLLIKNKKLVNSMKIKKKGNRKIHDLEKILKIFNLDILVNVNSLSMSKSNLLTYKNLNIIRNLIFRSLEKVKIYYAQELLFNRENCFFENDNQISKGIKGNNIVSLSYNTFNTRIKEFLHTSGLIVNYSNFLKILNI